MHTVCQPRAASADVSPYLQDCPLSQEELLWVRNCLKPAAERCWGQASSGRTRCLSCGCITVQNFKVD